MLQTEYKRMSPSTSNNEILNEENSKLPRVNLEGRLILIFRRIHFKKNK